jgi:hypothetical protein
MDGKQARGFLAEQLALYRCKTYSELLSLIGAQETIEVNGPNGASFQIEIDVFWDDQNKRNIRVCGAIDDGGWRSLIPLTDDFIMAPNGSFVGEQ